MNARTEVMFNNFTVVRFLIILLVAIMQNSIVGVGLLQIIGVEKLLQLLVDDCLNKS